MSEATISQSNPSSASSVQANSGQIKATTANTVGILDRTLDYMEMITNDPEKLDRLDRAFSKIGLDNPNFDLAHVSQSDWAGALLELRAVLSDLISESAAQGIEIDRDNQKLTFDERIKNIKESLKKHEDAKKAGVANKIFGWVAIAVTFAVAITATIVTWGTATPVAAASIVAMFSAGTLMVLQQAIPDRMANAFGDSKESRLAAMITWSVLTMLLSIGGGIGVAKIADFPEKVALIATAIDATAQVGSGASTIAQGEIEYDAQELQIKADQLAAFLKALEIAIENNSELIEKMIKSLDEATETAIEIGSDEYKTNQKLASLSAANA